MSETQPLSSEVLGLLEHKVRLIQADAGAIYLVGPIRLPVSLDGETITFQWYCWLDCSEVTDRLDHVIDKLSSVNLAEYQQSSVLVYGDFADADQAWIRFHSICHTGDIFGSKRCDCGYQLKQSMKTIAERGTGALFYLANQEGRGIGLFSKALAYLLQEKGYDTVDANLKLGFPDDVRNYGDAIRVLKVLRTKPVTVITNNPKKLEALKRAGMDIAGRLPLWGDLSEYNEHYLQTKIKRSGHMEPGCCNND
ncbi:GTP cyclohydrolase II [Paenibacillus ginsengarvi]|uniref:GTP cyclohydrolase II n=1 Tax=Paenibacillus ginsengarvi TaxID=400777 RepID=A0A3B0B6S4_9BACL|nr:GTP cyclohydrolase II [Paenibacillus ginsengarvi]RKN66137.1 GTP cyclohydrolase II [Paenibacillus ginsengarvi]